MVTGFSVPEHRAEVIAGMRDGDHLVTTNRAFSSTHCTMGPTDWS